MHAPPYIHTDPRCSQPLTVKIFVKVKKTKAPAKARRSGRRRDGGGQGPQGSKKVWRRLPALRGAANGAARRSVRPSQARRVVVRAREPHVASFVNPPLHLAAFLPSFAPVRVRRLPLIAHIIRIWHALCLQPVAGARSSRLQHSVCHAAAAPTATAASTATATPTAIAALATPPTEAWIDCGWRGCAWLLDEHNRIDDTNGYDTHLASRRQ
jgi:hypothetical protein